jgi:transcriptional regulator with XRE-family HTH domain
MLQGVPGRMAAARQAAGISRQTMAERIGTDFGTVGRWERGELVDGPPLWGVVAYAHVTGTPVTTIVEGGPASREELLAVLLQALSRERAESERRSLDFERRLRDVLGSESVEG